MAYNIGEAYISLRADYLKVFSDIAQMKIDLMGKLEDIEKTTISKAGEKAGKTFWKKFFSGGALDVAKGFGIATGVQAITSGIKGAIGGAIKSFMDFEFEMASVKAKANATTIEFRALEEAARDMGRTTLYNATQSAEALKVLVEMGLTSYEAIEALPKVLTLATTEAMNLADAADIALGSMRGMAMTTTDLDRIVDTIAYTAARSASTVYSLGQGLKVAGAAAHISGQSLEDVLSVLGGLANQMIRSETAGFAVTQMIARLTRAASTMKGSVDETGTTLGMSRDTIHKLGLELLTTEKVLKPLPQIFTDLKLKGASTLEILKIFGVYTYKYALAAMNASDTINELNAELLDTDSLVKNAGQRMADMKLDTLKGDVILAKNALYDLGVELGKTFSPAARVSVGSFSAVIRFLSNDIQEAKKSISSVPGIFKGIVDAFKTFTAGGTTVPGFLQDLFGELPTEKKLNVFEEADSKLNGVLNKIRNKVSIIKYDQFGLPIFGEVKIVPIDIDRLLEEEIDRREKAYTKSMTKVYSHQKVMSLANFRFQTALQDKEHSERVTNVKEQFALQIAGDKQSLRRNLAHEDAITDMIKEKESERDTILSEVTAAREQERNELLKKFVDSRSKEGIEEANKAEQTNARIAESFTRLASGMKENSKEYFDWKVKALDAQRIKELAIVEDTEEGRYLVEQWYNEQRKQLHYQEVERSTDIFGGVKIGLSKLADEGAMFGQIGEDWVYDLKSGFQSGFSTFFSDTLKGTKSWGESIKGLFTDIIGNILDSFAKAGAQLLANSLFNLLLGSFASVGTSGISNIAHTSKPFDTSDLTKFQDFSDPRPYAKLTKTARNSSSADNMVVQQSFNVNVTANDAQSVHQFFRRNGKIVQELAAQGVDKSRRLKKAYRGNSE